MNEQLKKLNENIGINGSLVITRDGVVIASCLKENLEEESVAALASSIINALLKPVSSFRMGSFNFGEISRFTLSARYGRLIFEIMESLVLVVVTDKNMDLDINLLEITGTANRLQRMTRISV